MSKQNNKYYNPKRDFIKEYHDFINKYDTLRKEIEQDINLKIKGNSILKDLKGKKAEEFKDDLKLKERQLFYSYDKKVKTKTKKEINKKKNNKKKKNLDQLESISLNDSLNLIISCLCILDIEFYRNRTLVDDENLKDKKIYIYDFYIPLTNTLIDFHWVNHFKIVPRIHGEDNIVARRSFGNQMRKDSFKRKQAIKEGFNYLRIGYKDYPYIFDILKEKISKGSMESIDYGMKGEASTLYLI